MNAKSTSSRQKLMAMAVVAMFAMCAFSVCLAADSDAGPYGGVTDTSNGNKINQSFDVKISVGQIFTYDNITTNLDSADGKVVITGAPATSGNSATTASGYPSLDNGTTGKKFVISFATPGTYTYTIKAVWTHNTETTLTQTATQTFTFTVSSKIALPLMHPDTRSRTEHSTHSTSPTADPPQGSQSLRPLIPDQSLERPLEPIFSPPRSPATNWSSHPLTQ